MKRKKKGNAANLFKRIKRDTEVLSHCHVEQYGYPSNFDFSGISYEERWKQYLAYCELNEIKISQYQSCEECPLFNFDLAHYGSVECSECKKKWELY